MIIKAILGLLIKMGAAAASLLPQHSSIAWPNVGPIFDFFHGLGGFNVLVDVPSLLLVVGLIIGFEVALLLYAAYRAVLGFIPALK
jgi:hypothetical protein